MNYTFVSDIDISPVGLAQTQGAVTQPVSQFETQPDPQVEGSLWGRKFVENHNSTVLFDAIAGAGAPGGPVVRSSTVSDQVFAPISVLCFPMIVCVHCSS